ncbi:sodium:proton antiporter [Gilvimarinus sp. SDUM040013]|uniref:Sodium:proton antiporter n=1 Tax=Gilvimarinus gilvus TaxID=3058038 RepID=A0ABU4RWW9_9GAMM|nr:sodium:proton antiporter [Gilvimarinus sp. SDUM040013]MDO3386928.1 sodium:proton antiporter [Gilvimarinus sp. SDUM040013]MDX6848178.1 sodium:proton antiporter [Gilvimarinus sp. SDUM040013]
MHDAALAIAVIGITALFCQWGAWLARLPAILFLLIAGLILGPVSGVLSPDELFGDLLFPLVSLAVAVILFEGSLTLNFKELGHMSTVVRRMITVAAPVTWVIVAVTTHYLFNLSWEISVLFGALMVVTGPTVVIPLLRSVRPSERVANILRWEGIVIDPIGALLVVVVYEFIVSQTQGKAFSQSLLLFTEIIVVGLSIGAAAGYALGKILAGRRLPEYLQNLATLSLLFMVFSFCNHLAHESGLLGVTVMGMWLGNMRGVHIHNILNFKENLTILFISGLFIILAARLPIDQLIGIVALGPLILLVVIQFVARPISVFLATLGSAVSLRERIILSWIAPRGIVAAAVSALFALRLTEQGFSDAEILVPLTFAVILGTVIFQSATSRPLARMLGIVEPEPRGVLILGANSVARTIAQALQQQSLPVILSDSNWENISAARMAGMKTFYGNPVSEFAGDRLELTGIGNLLALSPLKELNVIAGMHFRNEFGAHRVFTIRTSSDSSKTEKHQVAAQLKGTSLFREDMTYSKLASLIHTGAEIKATKLTEAFSIDDLRQQDTNAVFLFAITDKGKLKPFIESDPVKTGEGWTILSLIKEPKENKQPQPDSGKGQNV